MSAQNPITHQAAFAHAEKLLNDGLTFAQIKKMLEVKARVVTDEIAIAQATIERCEAEKSALREVYKHILGIERNASESISAQPKITNRPIAEYKYVPEIPAIVTPAEVIENAPEIVAITSDGRKTHVPDGTYTVVMANERRTIRIKQHWDETEKAKGTRVAQYLSGSDNESSYTGFAFISATGKPMIWKKFRNGSALLQSALAFLLQGDNHAEAGMTYAMESGNCWKCGRKLTVPASLNRGVGPECAKKLGL